MEKLIFEIEKRGIKKFEIFYENRVRKDVGFVQNEPEKFEEKQEEGIGLRIIKQGKRGFTFANSLENPQRLVENVLQTSEYGKEIDIEFPDKNPDKELKLSYEVKWDAKEQVEKGEEIVKRIVSRYKDLKVDLGMRSEILETKILNSSGLNLAYKKTIFSYYIQVFGLTPSGIVYIVQMDGKLKPDFDFERQLHEIFSMRERCDKTERINSGRLPVIFSPYSVGFFLRGISIGINGKNFEKGITPLKNKRDERILSEKITIYDNPVRLDLTGSAPFDGEGVPTQKFAFIEKGVLKDFLTDIETSKRTGIKPRGNGIRNSAFSIPVPNFNNIIIERGDTSLDEILKEIDRGIIVYETIGAGQSNILAGEYSFNVGLGFLVERGEIKGRIKDVMISGNLYEDFQNVAFISEETKKFYNYDLPYICVDGVKVTCGK